MRNASFKWGVLVLGLCSGGCDDVETTERDAARGWRSTQLAMSEAGVTPGLSGSGTVGPGGVTGAVEGTVACPGGGSVDVSSSGDVSSDGVDGTLRLEFDACEAEGIVIDGYLDYTARVDDQGVVAEYHGDLEWSGELEGSCSIDASASVTADGVSVSLAGSVCGHDWSDL